MAVGRQRLAYQSPGSAVQHRRQQFYGSGQAFNFNTPVNSGHAAALDGNAAANRVSGLGGTYTPATSITNGQVFYLRWADADVSSAADGIALDDLTVPYTLTNNPTATPMAASAVALTRPLAPPLLLPGLSGNDFSLCFQTVSGLTYQVQYADSLTEPVWRTLQSVAGDDTLKTVTVPLSASAQRFYRLILQVAASPTTIGER